MDLYNRRVAVLWDQPNRWFEGAVRQTARNGKSLIVYDDGEEIWHNLKHEVSGGRLRWLTSVPPHLRCTSNESRNESQRTGWLIDERKDQGLSDAREFRVRWFGCSPEDDTWAPEATVPRQLIDELRRARASVADGLRRIHASQAASSDEALQEAAQEAAHGVRVRPPLLAALPEGGETEQQHQQHQQQETEQQQQQEEKEEEEERERERDQRRDAERMRARARLWAGFDL